MQACGKTPFVPALPAIPYQAFGPLNKGQEVLEIEKNEASATEDLSFSMITNNVKNILEEQANLFHKKTQGPLASLKIELADEQKKVEALNKENALMAEVEKQNAKEIKALRRRLDLEQLSPKTVNQFQKSVDKIADNFKVLEGQIEEQKNTFDTISPQENKLKAKAFNLAWSSDNKDLKALARDVEDLFKPCMLDSKAHDPVALKSLNQSWSAVKTSDYKLEKSKQHLALKDQLRSFLTQLEDSHKALTVEVKDLTVGDTTPGVEYSYIHGYMIKKDEKAKFEEHLNTKLEKFNELQDQVAVQNKKFDDLAVKFTLLNDMSDYARRLGAYEEFRIANVQAFNKINKDLNDEKVALYNKLHGEWTKFNTLHVSLCTKIAVLLNGLASEKQAFPKESNATFDKQKLLMPVKAASLL